MREILFRGKRLDSGEWAEGYFANEKSSGYSKAVFIIENPTSYVWNWHRVDPATVGQYTGLQDKNGKRIFEGDIVKHNRKVFTIAYLPKYARFAGTGPKCVMAIFAFDACEVIGNIHDNPELLGGANHG